MTELPLNSPPLSPNRAIYELIIKSATTSLGFLSKYLSKDQNELQLPPLNKQFWAGPDPTKVGANWPLSVLTIN